MITLQSIQDFLEANRPSDADYLIVGVGVRGPNIDCQEGNAVATVRMGHDEATSEALHLVDAIALARGKILRERASAAGELKGGRRPSKKAVAS